MIDQLREIPTCSIVESPLNPRKTFRDIDGLAEDLRAHGMLQPILVRPDADGYEAVCGARRLRAARKAGLETVPAIIRDIPDEVMIELMVVENSHREDVHPLEEAEGYEMLHTRYGVEIEDIAAKVGKSRSVVYQRLKLVDLCTAGRKAFYAGKITPSMALLIARLPSAELQEKVLEEHCLPDEYSVPSLASVRETILRNYMFRLASAPFSPKDPDLVPSAGACVDCPKRTGNQPELFADVNSADACTDPGCFAAKGRAHAERRLTHLKERGGRVLGENESKKIWPSRYSSEPKGYVDLDARCRDDDRYRSYRVLFKGQEVPIVGAIHPHDGSIKELVAEVDARKALKALGLRFLERSGTLRQSSRGNGRTERIRKRATELAIEQVVAAVADMAEAAICGPPLWRLMAELIIEIQWSGTLKGIVERRRLGENKDSQAGNNGKVLSGAIKAMSSAELRGFVLEMLFGRDAYGVNYGSGYAEGLKRACAFFKVDVRQCTDQARREMAAPKAGKEKSK